MLYEVITIEVSDFDTTHHILEAIGFHRAQIYEKHRETYEMASVEICLDHLPFGYFIEIEGAAERLPSAAGRITSYNVCYTKLLRYSRYKLIGKVAQDFDSNLRIIRLQFK